jgi:hypothetical protein
MDTRSIPPNGDPFTCAQGYREDSPHACNDGWVTIGQIAVDPAPGEEGEEYALYLCRRCNVDVAR